MMRLKENHMTMTGFADRIGRALKVDASLYEEVEHDESALVQAMSIVALSSVATGVGAGTALGLQGLVWNIFYAFIGWMFWAAVIYFVGTKVFGTPGTSTDMGELLRVLGFASAPGIFRIFGVFSVVQPIVFIAVLIWMLVAMVIAVRQALDYLSTGRAIAVCVVGLVLQLLIIALVTQIVQVLYVNV